MHARRKDSTEYVAMSTCWAGLPCFLKITLYVPSSLGWPVTTPIELEPSSTGEENNAEPALLGCVTWNVALLSVLTGSVG